MIGMEGGNECPLCETGQVTWDSEGLWFCWSCEAEGDTADWEDDFPTGSGYSDADLIEALKRDDTP